MATGCDVIKRHPTPKEVPLEGWDAQPEEGDFSLLESLLTGNDVMKRHVPRRACPGKYGSAHARSEVPLGAM
jgi:hypothetical protein